MIENLKVYMNYSYFMCVYVVIFFVGCRIFSFISVGKVVDL